jgi:hypothetical protein
MLKYMLASLALTVGTIHPSIASEITQFPTHLMCVGQKDLAQTITEFEELSFAGGVAMRELPGVGMVKNNLVIFVNPKTQSWTIVERFTKDMYCIVALGEGFRPLSSQ